MALPIFFFNVFAHSWVIWPNPWHSKHRTSIGFSFLIFLSFFDSDLFSWEFEEDDLFERCWVIWKKIIKVFLIFFLTKSLTVLGTIFAYFWFGINLIFSNLVSKTMPLDFFFSWWLASQVCRLFTNSSNFSLSTSLLSSISMTYNWNHSARDLRIFIITFESVIFSPKLNEELTISLSIA